jgi:hypothetical protein
MHQQFPNSFACLIALTLLALQACQDNSNSAARAASAVQAQQEELARTHLEAAKKECRETLARRTAEYKRLMAAKKYWDASLEIRSCATDLEDSSLKALVAEAEVKSHHQVLTSASFSAREKLQAAQMLARDYPDQGKKYEASISKLEAQAVAQERAAEAAAKRKRGVTIGMTADEVLASSWGKPESVNKTTNSYGTREQWVYGGRNYLYFEDGKLTSIQN